MYYSYLGLFFNCNVAWEYLLIIPDDIYSLLICIYSLELLRCNTKTIGKRDAKQGNGQRLYFDFYSQLKQAVLRGLPGHDLPMPAFANLESFCVCVRTTEKTKPSLPSL